MSEKEKLSNNELQQVNGGGWIDAPSHPGAPIFSFSRFAPTGQKDEQGRQLCVNYPDYPHCGGCTDKCENGWRTGR